MSYRADKLVIDTHTHTHTRTHRPTDAGDDNTRRPKLASGKKPCPFYKRSWQTWTMPEFLVQKRQWHISFCRYQLPSGRRWGKMFCIKMYWTPAQMLLLADVDEYSFANAVILNFISLRSSLSSFCLRRNRNHFIYLKGREKTPGTQLMDTIKSHRSNKRSPYYSWLIYNPGCFSLHENLIHIRLRHKGHSLRSRYIRATSISCLKFV